MKNKKQIQIISLFLFIFTNFIYAQKEPFYKSYDWDLNPKHEINFSDSIDIVTLKDKVVVEFYFESDGSLVEYYLIHQILWLNSDEEIEKNNKIYIPFSTSSKPILNKARVITKEGKIINLRDDEILTAEDEETKQKYKYYTFKGIEKGSIIEYMYLIKKTPNYKGNSLSFQTEHLVLNASFELFSPTNLIFKFKSYNNLKPVTKDTTIEDKLHWYFNVDTIPLLEKEILSAYQSNRMIIIYKLDRNTASNQHDISSYGIVSNNIYNYISKEEPKDVLKGITKLIKDAKIDLNSNADIQIRTLEDYIKRNYFYIENSADELSEVAIILKNKLGNEDGLLKLYSVLFKTLKIDFQIVLTSDKTTIRFDKEFEANNFLTDYLFYFPSIDKYLSHIELNSRLGYPPANLTNNFGLFIKEVVMGDYKAGIGKINFIKPLNHEKTYDKIVINATFDKEDMTVLIADVDKSNFGYYASYTQPYMHLFDEKNKSEVVDEQIKFISKDVDVLEKSIFNDNPEAFGILPFQVKSKIKLKSSVDKAGNKLLFKIGELIGPQMEMYQEKKRILPLETGFNRSYHREITFTIPEGFKMNNLDDLNINNTYSKNGEVIFNFTSNYTKNGQIVTVIIDEYYTIFEIQPELFEEYRKVINSAADFNKITLVLEK